MNISTIIKKEVQQLYANSEVILFGSRARQDHRPDSDWDFLILLDKNELTKKEKSEIRDKLYEVELNAEQVISTLIHTKSDWEKLSVTPIYQIIQKEGVRA